MPQAKKERVDVLVQRLAGVTRAKAQALIRAGEVIDANGAILDKPGMRIPADAPIEVRAAPRFVSRGGEKLDAAFEAFQLDVEGRIAIDVGVSTGGFTDCLLQRGAARVYAVDVGYGQLAWKLRQDPRVTVIERTNIRHMEPGALPERPTFFVADCSFISLLLVLPPLKALLAPAAEGVVLIKPQFEAGPEYVGKGGVVRDTEVHAEVIERVVTGAQDLGFRPIAMIPSPLLGPAGNQEFLAYLRLDAPD